MHRLSPVCAPANAGACASRRAHDERVCVPTSESVPSQVLLDFELGDMTGMDVLRHIKKQSPDSPVRIIMVSGNEPSSDERMEFQEVRSPLSQPRMRRRHQHGPLLLLTTNTVHARLRRPALKPS